MSRFLCWLYDYVPVLIAVAFVFTAMTFAEKSEERSRTDLYAEIWLDGVQSGWDSASEGYASVDDCVWRTDVRSTNTCEVGKQESMQKWWPIVRKKAHGEKPLNRNSD